MNRSAVTFACPGLKILYLLVSNINVTVKYLLLSQSSAHTADSRLEFSSRGFTSRG